MHKSTVFESQTADKNNNNNPNAKLPPKSPAKGKLRLQQQSIMNDVLSYKGVPGFKDEYVQRKINHEKHEFVLQKTLQSIIED